MSGQRDQPFAASRRNAHHHSIGSVNVRWPRGPIPTLYTYCRWPPLARRDPESSRVINDASIQAVINAKPVASSGPWKQPPRGSLPWLLQERQCCGDSGSGEPWGARTGQTMLHAFCSLALGTETQSNSFRPLWVYGYCLLYSGRCLSSLLRIYSPLWTRITTAWLPIGPPHSWDRWAIALTRVNYRPVCWGDPPLGCSVLDT